MGNELTDERAHTHLACAIAELQRRGYDARGKSIAEVRQAVAAAETQIKKEMLQKHSLTLGQASIASDA